MLTLIRRAWARHLVTAGVALALVGSCGPGGGTPPQGEDGPPFVILSPAGGAQVASPVFFAIAPRDPASVDAVTFVAGGTELAVDSPNEDAYRVFLLPGDFPEGDLGLTATAVDKAGRRRSASITVHVVRHPPGQETVGAAGALLGATEDGGAISTLSVPPGATAGAVVTFSAMTKQEVELATGIDYDALGVTFLGAQEVTTSSALGAPLGVSSGGFGARVQPSQVVVNYSIVPDADGDGVDELVATNGASVAPNGDVISNPVPRIQVGDTVVARTAGSRRLRTQQTGGLRGPPGTRLELQVPTGLNPMSAFGNLAVFTSLVDGSRVELPASVEPDPNDPGAVPTVAVHIPLLAPGGATLVLQNVSSGESSAVLDVVVEAPAPLPDEPGVVIDGVLEAIATALAADPDAADAAAQLQQARTLFAQMADQPTAEESETLQAVAVFLAGSDAEELVSGFSGGGVRGQACSASSIGSAVGRYGAGILLMDAGVILEGNVGIFFVPAGVAAGMLYGGGSYLALSGLRGVVGTLRDCLTGPSAADTCLPPLTPSLQYVIEPTPPVPPPGDVRASAAPPPPSVTGMGSVVPPGGEVCGSASGGAGGAASGVRALAAGTSAIPADLNGRYIVKVFYGAGISVPFTGVSDPAGYVYIPIVPEGQPFEAVAFDTLTGETRSFEGVGAPVGTSTYVYFDFFGEGGSAAEVVDYDSNTAGTLGGVDVYLFEGHAGDLINLAVFTEDVNLGHIDYELSDAGGVGLLVGSATGGHYFDTGFVSLTGDGLYSFTVDGRGASGPYTFGLAQIAPPAEFDPSAPVQGELHALGDHQFYRFSGAAGATAEVTLSHDGGSILNAQMALREPLGSAAFYARPVRLRLATTDTRRSVSGTHTLAETGDYVVEVWLADIFEDELARQLGAWRIDVSLAGP